MQIKFNPQRRDDSLTVVKQGDALVVNGVTYDFSPLPEGATLPAEAIDSDLFSGPVERINGELVLTLTLPHGPEATENQKFPKPIVVVGDGPVELPK